MTEKKLSDEELVEADRKAYRARFIWGPIFVLYGFLAAVGTVYAIHIGLLPKAWADGHWPLVIMAAVLVVALPAIVFLARRYRIPKAARVPRVQRKLADDHQRRLRIANATGAIIVPLTAALVIGSSAGQSVWLGSFKKWSNVYAKTSSSVRAFAGVSPVKFCGWLGTSFRSITTLCVSSAP